MICITCNFEHENKFCPNCGEKSEVPKITFSSIFNQGFSTITNMDKGFLFNLKNLFVNPKKVVTDYIEGRRKNILNPISFLIICVSIYLIGHSLFVVKYESSKVDSKIFEVGYASGKFMRVYFRYFWIFSIIWLSLATKLVFKKYNYAEHLAINSFIIGQTTLVGLISCTVFYIGILLNPVVYISIFLMTYNIFKTEKKDENAFWGAMGSTVLFFIQLIVIVALIGIVRS